MTLEPHLTSSVIGSRWRNRLFAVSTTIILTCSASGQDIPDHRRPDTTFMPGEYRRFESLFISPAPPLLMAPTRGELDFSIFLRSSLFQVVQPGREPDQNFATLQWIWRDELTRGNRYQTLKNIVGAMELGAVGYLAYRHLKRYGLK